MLLRILRDSNLGAMLTKARRIEKRNATRQLPGGTGGSFKQNRRKALKLSARRKQRGLHKSARRKAAC